MDDVNYQPELLLLLMLLLRIRNTRFLFYQRMYHRQQQRLLQQTNVYPFYANILSCLGQREILNRRFWQLP